MKGLVVCVALIGALFLGTSNANAHCPVARTVAVGVVKAPVVVVARTARVGVNVLRRGREVVHNVVVHRQPVRSRVRAVVRGVLFGR